MNNNIEGSRQVLVDQDKIKMVVGSLRKQASSLEKVKQRADIIWERCETYLDKDIINSINTVKDANRKKYNKALEELTYYINKLETVAEIWQSTEEDIKKDTKNVYQKINDIFTSRNYIYKADVIIETRQGKLSKRVIGKNKDHLITSENELIPISDIIDIYKEKGSSN